MKLTARVVTVRNNDTIDEEGWYMGLAFASLGDVERKVLDSFIESLFGLKENDTSNENGDLSPSNNQSKVQVEILASDRRSGIRQIGRRRVVVTGLGIVSPIGLGLDNFWNAAVEGTSGIGRISSFNASGYPSQVAAEVKEFKVADFLDGESFDALDRCVQFGLVAAKMAMEDSGLDLDAVDKNWMGVSIGSGMGGMMMGERQLTQFYAAGVRTAVRPRLIPSVMANALAGQISMMFSLKGANLTNSTACSSSAHSIGQALNLIRWGIADFMIAGGAEACISPIIFSGFCSLRALTTHYNSEPQHASRPFDRGRDGFVLGEGAGMLILESLEHAEARQAKIYGEVIGYGATSEAYHMVIPEPLGKEAARTMRLALADAGISPSEIHYINAHATATKVGDIVEAKAIKQVFGRSAKNVPVSATKSLVGHTIGAAGAIASIACLMTVKTGIIHPTLNVEALDPLCDLHVVKEKAIAADVEYVMVNSFGFGSNNSSLIFKMI